MLLLSSISFAQIDFFEGSYGDLKSKAKGYKKNYFVEFYTDWCGYCKKMEATTFQNTEIGEVVKADFMAFKTNAEKEGQALAQELGVRGFPTVAFFNYKGELIGLHPGYKSAGEFMLLLDKYKGESSDVSILSFFEVNTNQIDQLKIKSFDQFSSELKRHIQTASDFGRSKKNFEWEEYLLDEVLSPTDEIHASLYFNLYAGNWADLEINILSLIEKKALKHEELAYLLCQFVENNKVNLSQVKWANELIFSDESSFYKELRIATLYTYGDVDDAISSYEGLKKDYKKNKIERERSMEVFEILLK
jgi:thioredoxin-related protein